MTCSGHVPAAVVWDNSHVQSLARDSCSPSTSAYFCVLIIDEASAIMSSREFDRFFHLLEASRLLDENGLARARAFGDARPEWIAGKLVKLGHLTRWQAKELLAGRTGPFFVGNYKILKPLGRGGMGTVFKASQPGIDRTVAVKIMSPKTLKDERSVVRFQREIRAAAAFDHPHIVHAFDAGGADQTYYLVMEYLGGRDLKQWLKVIGQLPVDWSCECMVQAALGLQYAHERGIVHRDIKPSNLLLATKSKTEWPHVKIADFGLARMGMDLAEEGGLTRIGQGLGTSEYVAPEQAQDSAHVDIRADIFSLGCTLFEMLTGQLAFPGENPFARLMARFDHEPPPVSTLRAGVPAELDRAVARMLQRDPDRRFQAPADVARALAPFARQGRSVPAAAVNGSESVTPKLSATSLPDTDPAIDQFLESLSGDMSGSRSYSALSNPQHGKLRRADIAIALAALAALLVAIMTWGLGSRG